MKKPLSLAEQVKAARDEVASWPESVRSATELRHSDLFQCFQDEPSRNTVGTSSTRKLHDSALEA